MPERAQAVPVRLVPSDTQTAAAPALALRRFGSLAPRVLVIGASTGGPQALLAVLSGLAPALAAVPVVIVLHMPQGFAALIGDHLARLTGLRVQEGGHGETLQAGAVYLARCGVHSRIVRLGDELILAQSDTPPVNFCKPAVDVLFRSAADACGPAVLGIVLTGMGIDGLAGAAAIADAGGSIVAQDETTSVVWGMPGAVARAGLCAAVAPVDRLGSIVAHRIRAGYRRART